MTNVSVRLIGLTHTFPDDIDILLVGPGGQNAIIMSDVGGSTAVTGVTLTLDDFAATSLPDAGPLVTGTFKPSNYVGSGTEAWPAPAPVPSGGSALSVFTGTAPNGTWSLYVVDDRRYRLGQFLWWMGADHRDEHLSIANANTDADRRHIRHCRAVRESNPERTGKCDDDPDW